jgi:uncharacterized membrane protein
MNRPLDILAENWFSIFLVIVALGLGAAALLLYRRRQVWSLPLLHLGAACALLGVGGLLFAPSLSVWFAAGAAILLVGMLAILIALGSWSAYLGYAVGMLLFLGLGGLSAGPLGRGLVEAGKIGASLEPTQPWWLLLLALIPLVVYWSYRSLAGLGPVRRWVAIGLRCLLILLLSLALAEVRLRHQNENTTVMFLVDRSLSIPAEMDTKVSPDAPRIDLREQRIEKFINDVVQLRGPEHKNDQAGLILFGRRPRLELPPSRAPFFNLKFKDVVSNIDGNYTDIAAAMKLALASFPEGTGKRMVIISDGNENLGNAEEQARIAKLNGVQIDVVPLAAGYRNENEVLVQEIKAPPKTELGSRLPITVLLRSYNPRTVYGTLIVKQITEGESTPVPGSPRLVRLRPGLNPFSFKQPLTNQTKSYTYQAIFQPEGVVDERGQAVAGLEGDRIQNNSATTHVIATGQRKILLIEQNLGDQELLEQRLRAMANSKYKVHVITPARLPETKADLGVFLSEYDCVILANLPAELLNEEQQEMIRSNTRDQGCGLVMIGGPDGFGAGGWQGTPVEQALPVDCDIKSFKVQAKGGLVLIMHACELADGNMWEKIIAKLAIKKLSPMDEIGIIGFELGGHKWHLPLQLVGKKRNVMLATVDRMAPGDMPDFDGPLKMAYTALTDPAKQLATRHIILITDGDPQLTDRSILTKMRREKVSLTTVGVATHGVNLDQNLQDMSSKASPGGKFHKVLNPRALPQIYIKETRVVSRSFVSEGRFEPTLSRYPGGPTEGLPDRLNPLYGYVRTTAKQSPLVEIPIVGPPQPDAEAMPILAYWHYGLGKSVAFTSDARSRPGRTGWDRDWAGSDMYSKFWEQVVEYALRPTETGRMVMTTEYNDGKVRVIVDARDAKNRPLTDLILQGGVTSPATGPQDSRKFDLKFEQKNSGLYEAEFPAEEAGSYFINALARRTVKAAQNGKEVDREELDSVRSGVTVPYSPEFADLESNTALLEKLRDMTGGQTIGEEKLARAADPSAPDAESISAGLAAQVYRTGLPQFRNLQPIWFWLLFLTGVLFFFDIAVRRIAIEPAEVSAHAQRLWERLRRRAAAAAATPQFIDRLQSRKAQVSQELDQLRAVRRFEPGDHEAAAPVGADALATSGPRPASPRPPQPRIGPESQQEATDYASRLLRAKQRVWQERQENQQE